MNKRLMKPVIALALLAALPVVQAGKLYVSSEKDHVVTVFDTASLKVLSKIRTGDKPRELALAAPLLRPGDYLLVHDVGREVHPADFPALPQLTPAWLDDTALALFRRPR